jgi:hypothetical protein
MANDAISYKLAMRSAARGSAADVKVMDNLAEAYDKNPTKANETAVRAAMAKVNKSTDNLCKSTMEYEIYTKRKQLPPSMGEDKIREAIYNDPNMQKLIKLQNESYTDDSSDVMGYDAFDSAYDKASKDAGKDDTSKRISDLQAKTDNLIEEYKDQPSEGFLNNVASTATGAVNSAVNGVTGAVTNTVNGAINGVTNTVNGVVNGVTGAVSGAINSAVNTVTGIKDTISNMVSNTIDGVVNTADKLANMAGDVKDKIANMFSSDSKKNEQTKALADAKANKGQKETATKVTEISPDQHAAMKQNVAVVTKPVTEVTTNTKSAPVDQKKEELPKEGPLSKVGDKLKAATGTVASMTDAVKSVTNEISSNIKKATAVVDGVKSKVTEVVNSAKSVVSEAVGTVKGAIDTVKNAANEVVGTAAGIVSSVTQGITSFTNPIVGTITDTISAGKALTNELASSLPGPLGQFVNAKSNEFFNKVTNKVMNNKLMKVNTVLNSLNGLATSDKLTNAVGTALLAHVGKKYANITDSSGLSLSHMFGDNDKDIISKYYDQIVKLCPDVTMSEDIVDYGNNKTLFDSLLNLLADSGASDLLSQLVNCPASKELYFDESSIKVLQEAAITARKNGDVSTYYAILEKLGKENMPNIKEDLIVLNANNDKDNAIETAITYKDTCNKGGIVFEDLLKAQPASNVSSVVEPTRRSAPTKMFDGPMVQLSCVSNTYIADQIMGTDMRKLVQASIYLNR